MKIFALSFALIAALAAAQDDGFKPIFDGKSFDGWRASDLSFWSIEEGGITGKITTGGEAKLRLVRAWQMAPSNPY